MLNIHSLETFGTHDGPGIRLVVFTQGCNLRCQYCHNPDTWKIDDGKKIKLKDIIELLEKQKTYFSNNGGLTVSGGEPLLQAKEIGKLFKAAIKNGFHTTLDTNGSIFSSDSKKVYELADLVLFDVKHINSDWHKKITGLDNSNVLKSIEYREKINKPMWLRYVLVPGLTDQKEFLIKFGEYFKDYKNIERLEILPYHTFGVYKFNELKIDYKLKDVKAPTKELIKTTKDILKLYFKNIKIG